MPMRLPNDAPAALERQWPSPPAPSEHALQVRFDFHGIEPPPGVVERCIAVAVAIGSTRKGYQVGRKWAPRPAREAWRSRRRLHPPLLPAATPRPVSPSRATFVLHPSPHVSPSRAARPPSPRAAGARVLAARRAAPAERAPRRHADQAAAAAPRHPRGPGAPQGRGRAHLACGRRVGDPRRASNLGRAARQLSRRRAVAAARPPTPARSGPSPWRARCAGSTPSTQRSTETPPVPSP